VTAYLHPSISDSHIRYPQAEDGSQGDTSCHDDRQARFSSVAVFVVLLCCVQHYLLCSEVGLVLEVLNFEILLPYNGTFFLLLVYSKDCFNSIGSTASKAMIISEQ
jgi:hypothetical protein